MTDPKDGDPPIRGLDDLLFRRWRRWTLPLFLALLVVMFGPFIFGKSSWRSLFQAEDAASALAGGKSADELALEACNRVEAVKGMLVRQDYGAATYVLAKELKWCDRLVEMAPECPLPRLARSDGRRLAAHTLAKVGGRATTFDDYVPALRDLKYVLEGADDPELRALAAIA